MWNQNPPQPPQHRDHNGGTHDGVGSGDIDPGSGSFRWGILPTIKNPFPFTHFQLARLMMFKGIAGVERGPNADGYKRTKGSAADIELVLGEDADEGEQKAA